MAVELTAIVLNEPALAGILIPSAYAISVWLRKGPAQRRKADAETEKGEAI